MITNLVRSQIRDMQDINWGDIPDTSGMRLLWGENQTLLPVYRQAIENEIDRINLYPSPTKKVLKEALSTYTGVAADFIIPTNGSDEALELIAKVFVNPGDEVIMPVPTFPVYASTSKMMDASIRGIPLERDFSLDVNKLLAAVTPQTKIIWIANPNNPTGNLLLTLQEIERIAKQVDCLLVIDECYFELTGVTASAFVNTYPNIIVVRSFSKIFAMAGARLGYILANSQTAPYLTRLSEANQPFNVNRFAQAAGVAILRQPKLIQQSVADFKWLKELFESTLSTIPQVEIRKTQTTFSIIKIRSQMTAGELKSRLKEKNIFIKDCSIYEGFGTQYVYLGIPQETYQDSAVAEIRKAVEG